MILVLKGVSPMTSFTDHYVPDIYVLIRQTIYALKSLKPLKPRIVFSDLLSLRVADCGE